MSDFPPGFKARRGMGEGTERDGAWERDVLARLAFAAVTEQRRARRWNVLLKFAFLLYLIALLALYWPAHISTPFIGEDHTAVVEIDGVIADDAAASADNVVKGLRAAFESKHTKGVVLRINSPGGSPVQAGYIYDEIVRLRKKHPDTPLYAVVTDLCASGGYYVAAAADRIYANKASVVGSIGVRMGSFGFVEAIDKLGVERRLLTAGEHKALMDPFLPTEQEQVGHLQGLLERIHEQFIEAVRQGRGDRLTEDEAVFSGLVWTGEEGLELGLVDGLASASEVARDVIGAQEMVIFTRRPDPFERLADRFGVVVGRALVSALGLESVGLR